MNRQELDEERAKTRQWFGEAHRKVEEAEHIIDAEARARANHQERDQQFREYLGGIYRDPEAARRKFESGRASPVEAERKPEVAGELRGHKLPLLGNTPERVEALRNARTMQHEFRLYSQTKQEAERLRAKLPNREQVEEWKKARDGARETHARLDRMAVELTQEQSRDQERERGDEGRGR